MLATSLAARIRLISLGMALACSGVVALSRGLAAEAPAKPKLPLPAGPKPLVLVVMDPLAAPLSCPCVKGYAQREYEKLAQHLQKQLKRTVTIAFSESLTKAVEEQTEGRADIIIGKQSVVLFDATASGRNLQRVALLSGKDGATTQTGLIVVPTDDPAQSVSELAGYRVIFGPAECDEKHAAAAALLQEHGVELADERETAAACDEGAVLILGLPEGEHGAAVISSYAKPLLEGCGTVKKGALRVVGETSPVPFVAAFVADELGGVLRDEITEALLSVADEPLLCRALETRDGFVEADADEPADESAKKKLTPAVDDANQDGAAPVGWTGWRGPLRDARVAWLPDRLPAQPKPLWRQRMSGQGLAGVAATAEIVVVADRDTADADDVFRALDAASGEEIWTVRYPARGKLDYGNSPRATPLIHDDLVYLLGAFGQLSCVELVTGDEVWQRDLRQEFGAADELVWGVASSPLLADGKLIVNPGARLASLAALDPETGKDVWLSAGGPAAFSSLIVAELGGRRQLVGYDKESLGGWDLATGKRLWKHVPPVPRDFNVPTPLVVAGRLFVTSENNGSRLFDFDKLGKIVQQPAAENGELAPDSHTPVAVGKRVFGVWGGLFCLDADDELRMVWRNDDRAFTGYASLLASDDKLLVATQHGELLLVDALSKDGRVLSRVKLFADDAGVYSHPALVGGRLYIRGSQELLCLKLGEP